MRSSRDTSRLVIFRDLQAEGDRVFLSEAQLIVVDPLAEQQVPGCFRNIPRRDVRAVRASVRCHSALTSQAAETLPRILFQSVARAYHRGMPATVILPLASGWWRSPPLARVPEAFGLPRRLGNNTNTITNTNAY